MSAQPRRRLWQSDLSAGEHALGGEEAHYALRVLRLKRGDVVELFDGHGGAAQATVLQAGAGRAALQVEAPTHTPAALPRLTVALACPKGERADWAVEKLTELGVTRIAWLHTAHGVAEVSEARLSRHQRLALAALRQSGGLHLPQILSGLTPTALLRLSPRGVIADRAGQPVARLPAPEAELALVVGPEGGLTDHELEEFDAAGYTRLRLGAATLRVETAALVGAALILDRSSWGSWGT